jgi:hypothetical protein
MRCLRALCILASVVTPVFGSTITGVFEPPTGNLGTSHTYTFSGWSIVATAFGPGSPDLFGKAGGTGETGVGLTNDSSGDNEITAGSFIQLDLFIFNPTPSTHLSPSAVSALTMDSTTIGEGFKISQSSTSGVLGTTCTVLIKCWTGTSNGSVTISPTLRYLDITATSGNVLLSSITFDDGGGGGQGTPEPLSFLLTGSGLIGIYFIRRRRRGSS